VATLGLALAATPVRGQLYELMVNLAAYTGDHTEANAAPVTERSRSLAENARRAAVLHADWSMTVETASCADPDHRRWALSAVMQSVMTGSSGLAGQRRPGRGAAESPSA